MIRDLTTSDIPRILELGHLMNWRAPTRTHLTWLAPPIMQEIRSGRCFCSRGV